MVIGFFQKTVTSSLFAILWFACASAGSNVALAEYMVSGRATYSFVPVQNQITHGHTGLNYSGMIERPIRRATVEAIDNQLNTVGRTSTDENGNYSIAHIPHSVAVKIRISAQSTAENGRTLRGGSTECRGASWNISILDNTRELAQWAIQSETAAQQDSSNTNLHAAIHFESGRYTDRSAAPFAILDTILTEMDMICATEPNLNFPELEVNWSPNNIAVDGNISLGQIQTTHFDDFTLAPQGTYSGTPYKLFVLGRENIDTDEFDKHIIAHEYVHYLESVLYRKDTPGGVHRAGDLLDPRVSFSEGMATALAAMTFSDPYYVDTIGLGQNNGFTEALNQAPQGNNRGIYNEHSVTYFLWSLFKNRELTLSEQRTVEKPYSRIHRILRRYQKNSPAFSTLLTFAAYYHQYFGQYLDPSNLGANLNRDFTSLWTDDLDLPLNALCVGSCSGHRNAADPFDTDNDIGQHIGRDGLSPRFYPLQRSSQNTDTQNLTRQTPSADFWNVYETLVAGPNSSQHNHSLVSSSPYSFSIGSTRWYRYVGTGRPTTIEVSHLLGATCQEDVLDMQVFRQGVKISEDTSGSGPTAGCPTIRFDTRAGETYVIVVQGVTHSVRSWTMVVSPFNR